MRSGRMRGRPRSPGRSMQRLRARTNVRQLDGGTGMLPIKRQRGRARCPSHQNQSQQPHTLKIAPSFFPSITLAPTSVTVNSAIPQTPIALAMPCPSPRRSLNA